MRVDRSLWHIIDVEQESTRCGLFLSQGSERRPLSETPEDRRCGICVGRFGGSILRADDERGRGRWSHCLGKRDGPAKRCVDSNLDGGQDASVILASSTPSTSSVTRAMSPQTSQ